MNYFRCTVGGSGGKLKLTVTCDSGFAGATISCTDGTTTLTATCPSSSPYTVIFKIPNGGTWIVSSGSNSTTVVISDTATLHQIPTGSTATPVNVIQTWLHCANVWNKNYTTINQVLADTSTLLALISSNNAADYMARSTNWASSVCANQTAMGYIGNNNYCANKLLSNSTWRTAICNSTYFESVLNVKVPTMTGTSTPSGTVIYDRVLNNSYAGYYAFDNNDSTWYQMGSDNARTSDYIGYEFTNSIKISKAYVKRASNSTSESAQSFVVEGYNGSSWVAISSETSFAKNTATQNIVCNPANAYSKARLRVVDPGTNSVFSIIALQFYGRA